MSEPGALATPSPGRVFSAALMLGAAAVLVLLVINVALTLRNTRQLNEDTRWVAHTREVMAGLENLLALATDAETGQRGFIVTGELPFLEPYTTSATNIGVHLDRLQKLTADNPRQQARFPALRQHVANKLNELEATIVLRKTSGLDAARQAVATGKGKAEMDALRALVGVMMEDERGYLRERSRESERTYQWALVTELIAGVIAFGAVVAFVMVVRRHLRSRAKAAAMIAEQAERLRTTLASIGDAVIATDTEGCITMMNPVAESLTRWKPSEATGLPLEKVFHIVNETTRQPVENPVMKALREGKIVGLANHTVLIAKDGTEWPIDDSASPIRCQGGEIVGCILVFRDVTERRETERTLVRSERELRDFFDNATIGLHWAGIDGTILKANQHELEMLGYQREEYVGRHLADFHADAATIADILESLKAGKALHEHPARLRCKDGYIKDVLISSNVLFEDGKFVHTRCFTQDITKRLKAEQTLREIQAFSNAIFESSPDCVKVLDAEGRLIRMNVNGLCAMEIDDFAPFKGRLWCDLWPQEGRQDVLDVLDAVRREGRGHFQRFCPTARGTPRWWDVAVAPIRAESGEITQFVSVSRDITKRKAAEQALRESEERYRTLFNTMDEGFCVIEVFFDANDRAVDYQFLELNAAFEKQSGLRDAKGMRVSQLVPTLEQHWFETYGKVALTGEPVRFTNYADSLNRWFDVYASRVGGPESRKVAVLFGDITARKNADEALRVAQGQLEKHAAELEYRVAERTSALRATNEQLEAFVYSIAHDLRSPLRAMTGFTQLLLDDHSQNLDSNAQKMLQRIHTSSGFMDSLLLDLLEFGRVAQAELELSPVSMSKAYEAALFQVAHHVEKSGARIEIIGELPVVYAHEAMLGQCLANLLSNAIKFVPPGVQPHIRIRVEDALSRPAGMGKWTRIWVEDNGIGIAPQYADRVFRVFERLNGSRYPGTGIGLSIVRKGIERMEGRIGLESEPGKGSRFWFELKKIVLSEKADNPKEKS